MELKFSSPVSSHYFALRCVPGDSLRQKITLTECRVSPADYTSADKDGFGNLKISGGCRRLHDMFSYYVAGTAVVQGMTVQKCPLHPMYRYPSKYTEPGPGITAFAEKVLQKCKGQGTETVMDRAVCAMHELYTRFQYIPGVTDIGTTAEQALELGKGVCQDYAHIMIAVMRRMGIPARYVNGLMIGEGATHAWVEIYTDGGCTVWTRQMTCISMITISSSLTGGLRGLRGRQRNLSGNASQEQKIYVNVEEISDGRDSSVNGTAGGREADDPEKPDHAGTSHGG